MKAIASQKRTDNPCTRKKFMREFPGLCLLLFLGPNFVGGAFALQNTSADNSVPGLYAYAAFLDTHADTASAIDTSPALVPGAGTLQQYPELSAFLEQHPDIGNQLSTNASAFQSLEKRYLALRPSGFPVNRMMIIWFDKFLSNNPQLKTQLLATPSSIDAPDTLSRYLTLKNFLQTNPYFPQLFRSNVMVLIGNPSGTEQ